MQEMESISFGNHCSLVLGRTNFMTLLESFLRRGLYVGDKNRKCQRVAGEAVYEETLQWGKIVQGVNFCYDGQCKAALSQIRSFVCLPNAFCFEVSPDIEIFIKILSVFSREIRRCNNFRPLFMCDRTQMEVDACYMRRMPSTFDHIHHHPSYVFQLKANETKLVVKGMWLRHVLWKHIDLSVNPHFVSSWLCNLCRSLDLSEPQFSHV